MQSSERKPITLIQFRQRSQAFRDVLYGTPDVQPRPIMDFAACVKLSRRRIGEAREKVRAAYSHDEEGA